MARLYYRIGTALVLVATTVGLFRLTAYVVDRVANRSPRKVSQYP